MELGTLSWHSLFAMNKCAEFLALKDGLELCKAMDLEDKQGVGSMASISV